MRTLVTGVLLVLAVGVGCGPSFQAVHEGEARFEHCYALDDSPNEPLSKKAECWNDWARNYTYGQTRDRVQYATQRYRALSRVPALPTDEALMGAAPGEPGDGTRTNAVAAPAPTSAFAPPPNTMASDSGVDAAARSFDAGVSESRAMPKSAAVVCAEDCETSWTGCRGGCEAKRCAECDRLYKACLRKCAK